MLAKSRKLISVFLFLSILTSTTTIAEGLKCSANGCYVDVKKFNQSKNMPKKVSSFKNKKIVHRFLTPLDKSIQVKFKNPSDVDIISLEPYKYHKQENEVLEPIPETEEINTITPDPEKFVATPEERKLYYEQQENMNLELIEPSLPMSLYYCDNDTEPIYDEETQQFNCIVSS
ncbi:hypothetical protein MNB_SV-14-628 [hydrothermal vent metagenome]|uniref:Uncharacterized protein n=1 Tax=hydrothermal vent metagenome TaxID=652676 RepID=A0A1W1BU46_9ZZZZ